AGISKRTFYHRFTGKEMLFEAVVRRLIERWTPAFDMALLEGAELVDGLRRAAEHMLNVALTPEALALHRMVVTEAQRFPKLARVMHELGAAAGVERIARHLETRIAKGEMRSVDPRFAAEQFILMVVTGPQRRALGLGMPLSPAGLRQWVDDTVALFLRGCGGGDSAGTWPRVIIVGRRDARWAARVCSRVCSRDDIIGKAEAWVMR